MTGTDYFWTDVTQASERLSGCVILYDNQPVYVLEVLDSDEGPKARIVPCNSVNSTPVRKMLNSPKFERFRKLPETGFMNCVDGTVVHVSRRIRTNRSHGYTTDNMLCNVLGFDSYSGLPSYKDTKPFKYVYSDQGFTHMHNNQYPSLANVLGKVQPRTALAVSSKYCVACSSQGLKFLMKDSGAVGVFVDNTTLLLSPQTIYLREEIASHAALKAIQTIKEF